MRTLEIPFSRIVGPSDEMITSLYEVIVDAIANNSEVFDYSIDDGLIRVHQEIDDSIQVLALDFPEILGIDYVLSFNGHTCDFVPCNDYCQLVGERMKELFEV